MHVYGKSCALALLTLMFSAAEARGQGWQHLGAVKHVERLRDGVELLVGQAKVRITAFNENVIRVRVAPQGSFPTDSSWAVIQNPELPQVNVEDAKTEVTVRAGN